MSQAMHAYTHPRAWSRCAGCFHDDVAHRPSATPCAAAETRVAYGTYAAAQEASLCALLSSLRLLCCPRRLHLCGDPWRRQPWRLCRSTSTRTLPSSRKRARRSATARRSTGTPLPRGAVAYGTLRRLTRACMCPCCCFAAPPLAGRSLAMTGIATLYASSPAAVRPGLPAAVPVLPPARLMLQAVPFVTCRVLCRWRHLGTRGGGRRRQDHVRLPARYRREYVAAQVCLHLLGTPTPPRRMASTFMPLHALPAFASGVAPWAVRRGRAGE